MAGNDFGGNLPVDSTDTLGIKHFVEIALALTVFEKGVFAFYTEIQDGRQKWQENDFGGNLPLDSADTLWVKNFVEIALALTFLEINVFLRFKQKFKMAAQSGRKTLLAKNLPVDSTDTLWVKTFLEIALARTVSEINTFLRLIT